MKETHTSLELSKKFHEAGFKGEGDWYWHNVKNEWDYDLETLSLQKEFRLSGNIAIKRWEEEGFEFTKYPAYDLLNDLCVKYAKELFGEHDSIDIEIPPQSGEENYRNKKSYQIKARCILRKLQENKKEEAENYLWENTILNPNNK